MLKRDEFIVLLFVAALSTLSFASAAVSCQTGWGQSTNVVQIPQARVNDGYCDCPTTGEDEKETGACAGFENWAGVANSEKERSVEQRRQIQFGFHC